MNPFLGQLKNFTLRTIRGAPFLKRGYSERQTMVKFTSADASMTPVHLSNFDRPGREIL